LNVFGQKCWLDEFLNRVIISIFNQQKLIVL
jgi:hypothetical protein